MPYTLDTKPLEVGEGQVSAALVELAGSNQAAPCRGRLQIEQPGTALSAAAANVRPR